MRNVREKQLKKCIIVDGDEFRSIVNQIVDVPGEVNYTYDGIEIYPATDTNKEITDYLGISTVFYAMQHYVQPLLASGELVMTIPEKPKSRNQKFVSSQKAVEK